MEKCFSLVLNVSNCRLFLNNFLFITKTAEQSNNGGTGTADVAVAAAVIANASKNDWPDAPTGMQAYHNPASAGPINDINIKLDQLMEIIQTQNCQITELRNEVVELRKSHSSVAAAVASVAAPSKPAQTADINTQKLELRLTRLIEEYLLRYEREHSKRLETFSLAR